MNYLYLQWFILIEKKKFVLFLFVKQTGKKGDFIMKRKNIVRYSTEELRKLEMMGDDKTDWQRSCDMKDEDIQYDEDAPEITEYMFTKALLPQRKKTEIRLTLDSDVLKWYINQNIAYSSLINNLLRSYMEAHQYIH